MCPDQYYGDHCMNLCDCPTDKFICHAVSGCVCRQGYTGIPNDTTINYVNILYLLSILF